ncbi:hypothetical protein AX16_002178 [Volvariella volvacea WC 439]|nr:hypothetical protein AX16_002178 [Volvariella volvacea WC 439]
MPRIAASHRLRVSRAPPAPKLQVLPPQPLPQPAPPPSRPPKYQHDHYDATKFKPKERSYQWKPIKANFGPRTWDGDAPMPRVRPPPFDRHKKLWSGEVEHQPSSRYAGPPTPKYFKHKPAIERPWKSRVNDGRPQRDWDTLVDTRISTFQDLSYKDMCMVLKLPNYVQDYRKLTLSRIQHAIQQAYGEKYVAEIFGSTRYGVSKRDSDLDIVILDESRKLGFPPENISVLPAIYDVRKLARTLQRAGFVGIEPVHSAKVPIVKFRDPETNLRCDINVNDRLGLINSDMISAYCEINPLLRPMLGFIKFWAQPYGLNEPSTQGMPSSFSSYAFALKTIGFFQTRGLLPNLQASLPPLDPSSNEGIFWIRSPRGMKCDVRYRLDNENHPPFRSLGEVTLDWFQYWGFEHDYKSGVVDIRRGGIFDKNRLDETGQAGEWGDQVEQQDASSETPSTPNFSITEKYKEKIVVMDPFITTKNVTNNVGNKMLATFKYRCQNMVYGVKAGENLGSLVPELASLLNKIKGYNPR